MVQPGDGVSIDQCAASRSATMLSRSSCSAVRSSQISLTGDMLSHAIVRKTKSGGRSALRSPAPCVDSEVDDSPLLGCSLLRRRLLGCCLLRRCSLLGRRGLLCCGLLGRSLLCRGLLGRSLLCRGLLRRGLLGCCLLGRSRLLGRSLLCCHLWFLLSCSVLLGWYYLLLSAALSVLLAVNFIRVAAAMFTAAPV